MPLWHLELLKVVWAASAAFPGAASRFTLGEEHLTNSWVDYVQGVTWVLRRSGASITGFDVAIESSVPPPVG